MATRKAVAQKEPTIALDRALKALRQQLEALQRLKNCSYQEATAEETEWRHFTESIIETAFGNPSTSLSKYYLARSAGDYYVDLRDISPPQRQVNFESRIREYESLLRSLVNTLELQLPEEDVKGTYEPADEYAFYRDLSSLFAAATNDILIVDAYLDERVFNLYVSKVPDATAIRILSNQIGHNVETVARMYAKSQPIELRSSGSIHDRLVFLDQRGWVIGQSIKDAARKKPTYLIELDEPLLTASRKAHNAIWAAATVIILAPL